MRPGEGTLVEGNGEKGEGIVGEISVHPSGAQGRRREVGGNKNWVRGGLGLGRYVVGNTVLPRLSSSRVHFLQQSAASWSPLMIPVIYTRFSKPVTVEIKIKVQICSFNIGPDNRG